MLSSWEANLVKYLGCLWGKHCRKFFLKMTLPNCITREYFFSENVIDEQFSSVQTLSRGWLFATPWTAALQASLSTTSSQSSLGLLSVESVVPPNHLILCLDEQNRFQIMMDPCHLDKALGLQMEKRTSPPRIPQTPGAHPWARLAWKGEQRDAAGWIPQASHSKRVLLSESEQLLLKS